MGTSAADRSWRQTFGQATVIPSVKTNLDAFSFDELFQPIHKLRLQQAIELAPRMVRAAIAALRDHGVYRNPTANFETAARWKAMPENPDDSETGQGLVKYFNLKYRQSTEGDDPDYWRCIDGIARVYELILTGLSGAHELVIVDMEAVGRVKSHGAVLTTPVSPIRATFGFTDEFGHTPYTWPERRGRIQLSWKYVSGAGRSAEEIGRTIVHEASHKWAQTKDILYKSQSWAKLDREQQRDMVLKLGVQREYIQRPDKAKPLIPMAGISEAGPIKRQQWLENADSYAWLARRLWKKGGRA